MDTCGYTCWMQMAQGNNYGYRIGFLEWSAFISGFLSYIPFNSSPYALCLALCLNYHHAFSSIHALSCHHAFSSFPLLFMPYPTMPSVLSPHSLLVTGLLSRIIPGAISEHSIIGSLSFMVLPNTYTAFSISDVVFILLLSSIIL